jgi:lipoyl(octanoyl) transferase
VYTHPNKVVQFQHLKKIDYQKAWDHQTSLFDKIVQQKLANRSLTETEQLPTENFLVFCEHPHVYTLGRSGIREHLLISEEEMTAQEVQYFEINRGGDITYHGPGQLVGYPILDLDNFFTDIHLYLRMLEEAVILTLADYGIKGGRLEGFTGVWLDAEDNLKARKICAMGVKASRWVTMHGFALNVNPHLSYFDNIVPCGISDKAVTSMARELGQEINMEEVASKLLIHLAQLFQMKIVPILP